MIKKDNSLIREYLKYFLIINKENNQDMCEISNKIDTTINENSCSISYINFKNEFKKQKIDGYDYIFFKSKDLFDSYIKNHNNEIVN